MEGGSYIQVVCNLFTRCNLHDQLLLLNELLPLLLKRDFLALVPSAVTPTILRYLTLTDIFSCLLVCKVWNKIINESNCYWTHICRVIGLSRFASLYPSPKKLALIGTKYQSLVKTLHVETRHVLLLHGSYLMVPIGCWLPNQEFFLAFSTRNVSIVEGNAKAVLCNTPVDPSYRVLWYASSPISKYVNWLGNDGTFYKWCLNNDLSTCTWTLTRLNHKIISLAEYHISCCSECSLICVSPKSSQNSSLWNIEFLYLDTHNASKAHRAVQFLPDEGLGKNPLFRLHSTVIKPVLSDPKQLHQCDQHRIFLQFGSDIAVYICGGTGVLKHMQTLHSTDDVGIQYASISGLVHKFKVSSNGEMIGITLDGFFHQWRLSNSGVFTKMSVGLKDNSNFLSNANCLAIGEIFSIIAVCNRLMVVKTETGAVLAEYGVLRGASPEFEFFPPYNQQWLNELLLSSKNFELLHLISRTGVIVQEFSTLSFTLVK